MSDLWVNSVGRARTPRIRCPPPPPPLACLPNYTSRYSPWATAGTSYNTRKPVTKQRSLRVVIRLGSGCCWVVTCIVLWVEPRRRVTDDSIPKHTKLSVPRCIGALPTLTDVRFTASFRSTPRTLVNLKRPIPHHLLQVVRAVRYQGVVRESIEDWHVRRHEHRHFPPSHAAKGLSEPLPRDVREVNGLKVMGELRHRGSNHHVPVRSLTTMSRYGR